MPASIKTPVCDQLTRREFFRRHVSGVHRIGLTCVHRYPFSGCVCENMATAFIERCKCGVYHAPLCTMHYNKHRIEHPEGFDGVWVGRSVKDDHRAVLKALDAALGEEAGNGHSKSSD